jgi:hypothetical protein
MFDKIVTGVMLFVLALTTIQYGIGFNGGQVMAWLYLASAAVCTVWVLFNSRGKTTKDAMTEATLPFITCLTCLYNQAHLL